MIELRCSLDAAIALDCKIPRTEREQRELIACSSAWLLVRPRELPTHPVFLRRQDG